jgi:hypothetical protein
MLRKLILPVSFALIAGVSLFDAYQNSSVHANKSGGPAGNSSGPGQGNCTSCHTGSTTTSAGLITTDIPASGYVQGTTYNVKVAITDATSTRFGFQLSAHNTAGAIVGTLINTNNRTKLVGNSQFVTHTSMGLTMAGQNTNEWEFQWVAPSASTGTVTFHTAVNASNSNDATSGDRIFISSLPVNADQSVGISNLNKSENNFRVYSTFAKELKLEMNFSEPSSFEFLLSGIDGKQYLAKSFAGPDVAKGMVTIDGTGLASGIYIARIQKEGKNYIQKLYVK